MFEINQSGCKENGQIKMVKDCCWIKGWCFNGCSHDGIHLKWKTVFLKSTLFLISRSNFEMSQSFLLAWVSGHSRFLSVNYGPGIRVQSLGRYESYSSGWEAFSCRGITWGWKAQRDLHRKENCFVSGPMIHTWTKVSKVMSLVLLIKH